MYFGILDNIHDCWHYRCAVHHYQILYFRYGRRFILSLFTKLVRIYSNLKINSYFFCFWTLWLTTIWLCDLILRTRYPFNWKSPFGYLVASFCQYIGVITTANMLAHNLNLFIGSCWLFKFIANDIKNDLTAFNAAAKAPDADPVVLTKRFCDLVQIHSDAKQ